MRICWFCGKTGVGHAMGLSFESMLLSDSRRESPSRGEPGFGVIDFTTIRSKAEICEQCWNSYRETIGRCDDKYLEAQKELWHVLITQECDVGAGICDPEEKELKYGCWFGHYPLAAESRVATGMRLVELFGAGVFWIPSVQARRSTLEDYLAQTLSDPSVLNISPELAKDLTAKITLSDDSLTNWDRQRIAASRVWVLDATLAIHEFSYFTDFTE